MVDGDGHILAGAGFTATREAPGVYTVRLAARAWPPGCLPTPLATPAVLPVAMAIGHASRHGDGSHSFSVLTNDAHGVPVDSAFFFAAFAALPRQA